ncbi:Uncharacterised protein [uncultured Clostridium sp.]|uniref:hypothetical protein n=1 Tax=uncultured Clostridium sp. TaxID=59620 RepID=UPI000822D02D|nr:hypothetical protein [uncultured Clostridium sp.]SCK02120.1 Uncharacterised protein [uncultured Clostridium sp.]
MSFENQLEELEKKSNLILEKFGYIIQRQDELEKVNKEILERMTTLSVDLAETLVSIIDNTVKDSIIEKIIEAELRLERIVLDRTRSDEVREFYNGVLMAIDNKELPSVIGKMVESAYMDKGIIKVQCYDKKLYKILNYKYLKKINEYSDYQVRFEI